MDLTIRHITRYAYDPGATSAALRLRLFPPATDAQAPDTWSVTVNDTAVAPLFTDAAGEPLALWHQHAAVEALEIIAEGRISTKDTAGVLNGLDQRVPKAVYLRETDLTKADPGIIALSEGITGTTPLERLHTLSEAVGEAISYRPGATSAGTTAMEAMATGAGVCQDQAHVFIAAARAMGVPARYVVGYLLDADSIAAEETHAWAEAHVPGLGWTGFDVTHQLCPTDAYVRLCTGLDAADAAPIRGTVMGETKEELSTEVHIATASQSQSQQ